MAGPTTRPVRRLGQLSLASATFSTVAVGSFAAGSATTEASTQPTSRLMRSRWAPVQASRTHDPVTPPQAHRPFSRSRGVHLVMLSRSISSAGSSPLARGSHRSRTAGRPDHRIIPARAGFTALVAGVLALVGDHPRSRGVYTQDVGDDGVCGGSSPLARGLHSGDLGDTIILRIIPARAGFTQGDHGVMINGWDHPRSRGVYVGRGGLQAGWFGSSPLARGLRRGHGLRRLPHGIIPARAGFTLWRSRRHDHPADHPRSRGVYPGEIGGSAAGGGSSPLARGLRRCSGHRRLNARIIPARAGFTGTSRGCPRAGPDHPRSRGVYSAA